MAGVRKRVAGFTLIELLVVIAIIALLLAILAPSLATIKERAERVVCRTNLHQWAIGLANYAANNAGKYPSAFGYTGNDYKIDFVVPNEIYLSIDNYVSNPNFDHPGQISWELMAPYIPSEFNYFGWTSSSIPSDLTPDDPRAKSLILEGAWTCPAYRKYDRDVIADTLGRLRERGFMRLRYSYYGRVDLWPGFATHPEDFGDSNLSGSDLLMSDALYNWAGGVDYNHSIAPTKFIMFEGILNIGDHADISGMNKLFGDGHAVWKDRRDFLGLDAEPHLSDISYPSGSGRRVKGQIPTSLANNYY